MLRAKVTTDVCFNWLTSAYNETLKKGYCEPTKFECQTAGNVLPTVAVREKYVDTINVDGLPACKKWLDLDVPPTIAMAEEYRIAYVAYCRAKGHGAIPQYVEPEEAEPDREDECVDNLPWEDRLIRIEKKIDHLIESWDG